MNEAYALLGAHNAPELSRLYTIEDQNLMKSGEWDYKNPSIVINKVKTILESIDPEKLSDTEAVWQQEILWFWYHHAISCAIWKYRDKQKAQEYAAKALQYQGEGHPNKITQLLDYLVNDKLKDAERWVADINEEPEKTTATDLLREYKEKGLF